MKPLCRCFFFLPCLPACLPGQDKWCQPGPQFPRGRMLRGAGMPGYRTRASGSGGAARDSWSTHIRRECRSWRPARVFWDANPKKNAVPGFGAARAAAHPKTVQEEGRARTELQGGRDGGCNVSIDAGEWKYLLVAAGPATLGTEPSFGLLVLPTARPLQPRSQGAEPCRAFRCASSAVLASRDLVHSWSARPELAAPRRPWARRAARPCSMPPKEQVHVRRCVRTPAHVLHLPLPLALWARRLARLGSWGLLGK